MRSVGNLGTTLMVLGIGLAVGLTYGNERYTALAGMAVGAILGLAASRAGRPDRYRQILLISAGASEVIAVWMLMKSMHRHMQKVDFEETPAGGAGDSAGDGKKPAASASPAPSPSATTRDGKSSGPGV